MSPQLSMSWARGEEFADWVRTELAAADHEIRRVLTKHPHAVRAADDPAAVRTGWLKPDPFHVLVFTEYGIGDPAHDKHVWNAFDKVAEKLRTQPWVKDGGWESLNPAVQYFWITPFAANPTGLTAKGERMYGHVKASYAGDPRAKEIAARTVYARAAEGAPGLRRTNPTEYELSEIAGLIDMAMARTLWVTSYADWTENLDEAARRRLRERDRIPGAGENWEDYAPATPPSAYNAARRLIRFFEEENGATIDELLRRATVSDGKRFPPGERYIELFGHYLAMQALGHGVSWFDDHATFPLVFPRIEAHSHDGRHLSMSGGGR